MIVIVRLIVIAIMLTCLIKPWARWMSTSHLPSGSPSPVQLLNPLTATVSQLQEGLSSGAFKSTDLVQQSMALIQKHDGYLKAILATSPESMNEARRLDEERAAGRVRSPLHGIPILIKDNIATHPQLGMDTTAGSFALKGSCPKTNAVVVQMLIDAGAIIIAKSQLSEFAFYKGTGLPSGWSALGGQAQSAYTNDDVQPDDLFLGHSNPGGSSTGSAVGVSAGYAPISIGTDTTGSVIIPATRATLYRMRVTKGIIPMDGVIPLSNTFDSIGPMAKSVEDLANMLDIMVDSDKTSIPEGGYKSCLEGKWSSLRIGVLDPEKWQYPPDAARPNAKATKQMVKETKAVYQKLRKLVAQFYEVELISLDSLDTLDGKGLFTLFAFLSSYSTILESSQVQTLQDVIRFNKAHASEELPPDYPQQDLLIAAANNTMASSERTEILNHVIYMGKSKGIDETLEKYKVDVILGPADCYPSVTMPLSYLKFNGRPFGVFAIAKAHREDLLLNVLSAWEKTFPSRKPPPL
ncbi:amidase signature enzyme [Acephala macrosclerotiorum]|nr:amidase signature enzyme [Acephala macrosclerotiorum]